MKFFRLLNTSRVACERCIYYVPREEPSKIGKCRRFGEQHPETKVVTYYYSDVCRKEEHQCGKKGKYFIDVLFPETI